MPVPLFPFKVTLPSGSADSSASETYDYAGLEDHLKRQDMLGGLRDAKFSSLYGGDVAGSVVAGNKIRDLLKAVNMVAPGTDERDPVATVSPPVRLASSSSSGKTSADGGGFAADPPAPPELPEQGGAPAAAPDNKPKPKKNAVVGNRS